MAIQTTVTLEHGKAYAGQIVDLQLSNKISIVNTTDKAFEYGQPVYYPETEVIAGICVRTITDTNFSEKLGAGVLPQRDATVLTDGVIWVIAPTDVVIGDNVYITDGKLAATGDESIDGATYVSTGTTGDLVKLKLTIGG